MSSDLERYKGLASFRFALRRFLASSESICRDAGITPQQYQAMLAIRAHDGSMAMKDLAEHLMLTHHAAVQLVDRLEKNGLAAREPSTDDRRSVSLKLLAMGETLLEDLASRHLGRMLELEPELSKSLKRLRRLA